MKRITDLVPTWHVENVSWPAFADMWAFNPTLCYRDGSWWMIQRNCDYHMKNGAVHTVRRGGKITTRNVLFELHPVTWQPIRQIEIECPRELARYEHSAMGLEDLRLFFTSSRGFCALATSMMLSERGSQEMMLLELDERWQIRASKLLRGPWSSVPQKNWVPFDGAAVPTFLYSIDAGLVFDEFGPITSLGARDGVPIEVIPEAATRTASQALGPAPQMRGSVETKMHPRAVPAERAQGTMLPPGARPSINAWSAPNLRGGSQLVAIDDDGVWLGIGHHMEWDRNRSRKNYWHVFYTVSPDGKMIEKSQPIKLSECAIEFAAGMGIDEDGRIAISYGTDDADSWIATCRLEDVLGLLEPIGKSREAVQAR